MPKVQTEPVDLFTHDEDAILAQWLGVRPHERAKDNYSRLDGASAFILLERGED
jgi:hypothetical protein